MTNRGVSDAIVMPNDNTDRFTLPCYIPAIGAPASDFNSEVDSARARAAGASSSFTGSSAAARDGEYQPVNLSDYPAASARQGAGDMWIGSSSTWRPTGSDRRLSGRRPP